MKVTVVNRKAMKQAWGSSGPYRIITKTIKISSFCHVCGEKRGEPEKLNMCEDGDYAMVNTWTNPCGHLDKYCDVLKEAELNDTIMEEASL